MPEYNAQELFQALLQLRSNFWFAEFSVKSNIGKYYLH